MIRRITTRTRPAFMALVTTLAFVPIQPGDQSSGVPTYVEANENALETETPEKALDATAGYIEVMQNPAITGLPHEFKEEDLDKVLKEQIESFVAYRKGKLGVFDKAVFIVSCLARPTENLFCDYLKEDWDGEERGARWKSLGQLSREKVKESIVTGAFEDLARARTRDIRRVLRRMKDWSELEPVIQLATTQVCAPLPFLTNLGVRIERFFPEEKYREAAKRVYAKASECGGKNETLANLARFRLSLLHIWSGSCSKAEPYLKQLLLDKERNHVTRAMYWRAQCEASAGDKIAYELRRNQLFKINPLGYHALALSSGRPFELLNLVYSDEPARVRFRSRNRKDLNSLVRLVELLLKGDEKKEARRVVHYLNTNFAGTEPGFKLYLSVLAHRSEAVIAKFRFLSSTLRFHPGMITRETLKNLYPLKNFKTLWTHRRKVDPYLVAALIRQESGFLPGAKSSAGALGLMQLLPSTARQMARVSRWQLLKPSVNVRLGVKYFGKMLRKFNGDAELALAAYNAGPRNVDRWIKRYPVTDRMLFLDLIPFSETRNYVSLIGRNYYWYLSLYAPEALELSEKRRAPASLRKARRSARFTAFSAY